MREKWTLRVFMWLYLSFFASASVYLLYSGLYFDVMGYSTNQRFTKYINQISSRDTDLSQ